MKATSKVSELEQPEAGFSPKPRQGLYRPEIDPDYALEPSPSSPTSPDPDTESPQAHWKPKKRTKRR
jgi:hypothetical protein